MSGSVGCGWVPRPASWARGGARIVAPALGVAGDTVRRGPAELDEPQSLPYPRSCKTGGGRKRAEEGDPGLVAALDKLVDPVTRGDPMSPLRWTSTSLRTLAKALQGQGHQRRSARTSKRQAARSRWRHDEDTGRRS